jgi:diguanylate cyclase (GGDEF)-like protein
MGRQWSRDELRALASGWLVYVRDRDARDLPVPDWLAEVAGEVGIRPTAERLAVTHAEDRARNIAAFFEALARPGEVVEVDVRIQEEDGWTHERIRWLNLLDHDDVGAFLGSGDVLVISWDIGVRRAQEAALEQSREDLRSLADDFRMLADEVPAGVFRCDAEGVVDFNNARWTELVGGAARLHDAFHPDHWPVLDAELHRLLAAPGDERTNLELGAADGRRVLALTSRAVGGGGDRVRQHVVGSVNDVTDQVALRRSATHDVLTGLLNRRAIEERLAGALAVAPDGMLVVSLDLDGFKGVNDDHGHDVGDLVLRTLGRRLTDALRPGDVVGRFGGDEFVVVCEDVGGDVDGQVAVEIADRMEQALVAPIPFPGGSWSPTASIGTARPRPGEDLLSVLRRADQAMYAAKRHRRGAGQAPTASATAAPDHVSPPG